MKPTALILEDSKTQSIIIGKMIEAQGWTAVHCEDIRTAMDIIQVLSVQAMFLDIHVGERNTLRHFDRFRHLAGENVSITLMTAGSKKTTAEDTLAQARKAQADHILRKPFSETLIRDILYSAARPGCCVTPS